ncbi:TadE/TadG family type IV pilus assembly protein [Anaeromyxobacter oryzae]|uniref:TadE-like domain-containing protein n=1 Tax=Anaeromyxobacter oryzae TaxID=2918170 RepID=A0ABM7WP19_9BACT|nr:TadE/TadG family type IV pilus assembly protein [Anaeromyxobacter oryzae]BDG01204.1 hypothetical protein AMOR_02000 [Anaeromyxobacter oryzae]
MSRRSWSEQGAAAVEFALVFPVLVALLCGTIDWGYYFFTRAVVVNASREGARVGTLQFPDGVDAATQAETAARTYLENSLATPRAATAEIDTTCPRAESSCVRITYHVGGSVTGLMRLLMPDDIVAYAEMRK